MKVVLLAGGFCSRDRFYAGFVGEFMMSIILI